MNFTNTPFKIHNENAGVDTRIKQSAIGNMPIKAGLGAPQSNRKALGHLSNSILNTRQTPAGKSTLGNKDFATTKSKLTVKPQIFTVTETIPDYNPEDLLTFGHTTVVEDPYDKVQRLAKLRAKSGISMIDESELDQDIIAAEKNRLTTTDYDSLEFLQPLDGLNDADYQDLMSSFMEFDD